MKYRISALSMAAAGIRAAAGEGAVALRHAALAPWLLALALTAACPFAALAAEGGVTHVLPGSAATLIDLLPTKPGWVAVGAYLSYEGDTAATKQLPVAGLLAAGLNAKSSAVLAGGFYTSASKVQGPGTAWVSSCLMCRST